MTRGNGHDDDEAAKGLGKMLGGSDDEVTVVIAHAPRVRILTRLCDALYKTCMGIGRLRHDIARLEGPLSERMDLEVARQLRPVHRLSGEAIQKFDPHGKTAAKGERR